MTDGAAGQPGRKCVFCVEVIDEAATVCPHCRRDQPPKGQQPCRICQPAGRTVYLRQDSIREAHPVALAFGIILILLACFTMFGSCLSCGVSCVSCPVVGQSFFAGSAVSFIVGTLFLVVGVVLAAAVKRSVDVLRCPECGGIRRVPLGHDRHRDHGSSAVEPEKSASLTHTRVAVVAIGAAAVASGVGLLLVGGGWELIRELLSARQPAKAISPTSSSSAESASVPEPSVSIPQDQQRFIGIIASYREKHEGETNELRASAIRSQRRMELAKLLPKRRAVNWVGTLKKIETNSDGRGILYMQLHGGSNITLMTWNNALSDVQHGTLIPQKSPIFAVLTEMKVGEVVVFSGRFFPHGRDHIYESSVSEKGAMKEPEFIIRFSDVRRYDSEAAELIRRSAASEKEEKPVKRRPKRAASRPVDEE